MARRKAEKVSAQSIAELLDFKAVPKAAQALRLRRLGYTYARIAEQLGYADESNARKLVKRASEKIVRDEARDLVAVQLDHIDEALQVVLKRVLADDEGSLWAVDRLIPLLKRQAELMGLDVKGEGAPAAMVIVREYPAGVAEAV